MQVLCLYGPRKSKPRVKSELGKQQYTLTLFDGNHLLAQVIHAVLWQMEKLVCYCKVFSLFYFEFDGSFQLQAPGGLYLEGRFNEGFFALRIWGGGLIFGWAYRRRGLLSEFYGMYPKLKLVNNLAKPIFRLQNTGICFQKCPPYRAAKLTSMT